MYRSLKILGVLAIAVSSIGQASAFSSSVFPISLTGGQEDFVLSYTSAGPFNLSNLSLESGSPGSPPNIFASTTAFSPYTGSSSANNLTNSGTISEILSVPAGNYTFSYSTTASSLSLSVSPVPLPASFSLFALALISLGFYGYHTARKNGRTNSVSSVPA
jgi:hypothetical protein